jgi:hypothetical protein
MESVPYAGDTAGRAAPSAPPHPARPLRASGLCGLEPRWLQACQLRCAQLSYRISAAVVILATSLHCAGIAHSMLSEATCLRAGNDGSLRIWNVSKGACMLVVKQHSAEVTSAVWLPDGERIITGSHDKNMVLTPCRHAAVAVAADARLAQDAVYAAV